MTGNIGKKLRQCFIAVGLMIFAPLMPVFAQPQPEVTSSVSIVISLEPNCTPTPSVPCYGSITGYLNWSKSSAFPHSPPSSIGYWSGYVFRQATAGGGATIIGGPPDYQGTSQFIWVSSPFTPQGISDVISSIYAAGWYAFTTYIDPNGVPHTISSSVPPPLVQDIGDLAWAEEPSLEDKTLTTEHNLSCAGDPVYLHNGQFSYECSDLEISGRKLDVNLRHAYLNGQTFNGPFGYGWFINYYMRLHKLQNGDAVIVAGDGRKNRYPFSGGAFSSPAGRYEALTQNPNGTYTLTFAQGDKYQFDAGGKLTAIQDRNSNTISFGYSSTPQPFTGFSQFSQSPTTRIQIGLDYRLETVTDTTGRVINFNYNTDGLLSSIVDGTRQVTFTYDPNTNDLLTVTKPATPQYPLGLTKTFTYTGHNLETVTDPKNQTFVTNHYNTDGRVQTQDLGAGSFQFAYTLTNNVVVRTDVTDRNANVVQYNFNATGNVIAKTEFTRGLRPADPPSFTTAYTYNSDMERTSVTFPRGNGVKYTYDSANPSARAKGNLLEVRRKTDMAQPDNNTNDIVTTMTYETMFNQVKTITDPRGQVTTFLYDYELPPADPRYNTKGDLADIYFPAILPGIPVTRFAYNTFGQPLLMQDPNGILTALNYYPTTGYLQSIARDPTGINAVTAFTYDNFGTLDQVTDAENHTVNYDFNALGWLIQEVNPLSAVTQYFYDKNGNVETITRNFNPDADATDNNQTTQFTYTILNKLATVRDPLNRLTTFNYDNNENLASILDAENHTTLREYDERDLLFKIRDANTPQGTTQYDYDINGNLGRITDANNNATNYVNDLFDRQQTITYADTKHTDFVYDKNSNLTRVTRGNPTAPKVVEYDYDNLNNLIAKRFPASSALDITYQYDLGSRLTLARHTTPTNPLSIISFPNYDNLNRATTVIQTLGALNPLTLTYQYDKVGNRKQVVYPSGKVVDYTYDAKDQMDLVKVNTATLADYTWDLLNRRQQLDYMTTSVTRTTYSFDLADQLAQVNNQLIGGANPVSRFNYFQYDNVGNRKKMDMYRGTNPVVTHNYAYNNIYELTGVTGAQTHTYQYDNVANRTNVDGTTYVPNNLNQYTTVGAQAYGYDASGNLTNDGVNTYTYDEENRLSGVTNATNTATYQYDGFNRRISKTVNGVTTYFISDGDREVEERDGTGALLADYVYGDSIDEVLTMTRGGSTYHYLYDGLGSVTDILNSSGVVVESYNYDVYGQPSVLSTIGNPYYFTGRRLDLESGKQYQRRRTYDQFLGRFHQRDPIGYYDSMNLYQYAFNSPTNYVDPYGEAVLIPLLIAAGVGAGISAGIEITSQLLDGRLENCGGLDFSAIGREAAIGGTMGLGLGGLGLLAKSMKFSSVSGRLFSRLANERGSARFFGGDAKRKAESLVNNFKKALSPRQREAFRRALEENKLPGQQFNDPEDVRTIFEQIKRNVKP